MLKPNRHGPACKGKGLINILRRTKHVFFQSPTPHTVDERLQVVISRYKENIDWSSSISNRIVYNKGPTMNNAITLPNVGREGHTFAYHIVQNYDNLFEYTCFLQGDPFDHCPNLFNIIKNISLEPFVMLTKTRSTFNLDRCPIHRNLPLRKCYKILFNSDSNANYDFGHGAQMIVSRAAIHSHPKEFYQKIVDMLGSSVNPIEGFVIERFWKLIFSLQA